MNPNRDQHRPIFFLNTNNSISTIPSNVSTPSSIPQVNHGNQIVMPTFYHNSIPQQLAPNVMSHHSGHQPSSHSHSLFTPNETSTAIHYEINTGQMNGQALPTHLFHHNIFQHLVGMNICRPTMHQSLHSKHIRLRCCSLMLNNGSVLNFQQI
jgi:hypothetical protein